MENLLICPICQKQGFKNLNTHIVRVHKLSINAQDKKSTCLNLGYNYEFITEDELFNE